MDARGASSAFDPWRAFLVNDAGTAISDAVASSDATTGRITYHIARDRPEWAALHAVLGPLVEDFRGLSALDDPTERAGHEYGVEYATEDGAYAMIVYAWRGQGLSMYAVGRTMAGEAGFGCYSW